MGQQLTKFLLDAVQGRNGRVYSHLIHAKSLLSTTFTTTQTIESKCVSIGLRMVRSRLLKINMQPELLFS